MSLITHTYTADPYEAHVFADHYVELFENGILIERPGPWRLHEEARYWAETIVARYALEGRPQGRPQ